ncbi:uncharacterized protein RAG0_00201 [Rhynchosporium agropyri]|uniref:Uncharacterized protein n=1 Tax=Rhynchosporium agropyri TaxID=914238 RepID=A0A1E1JW29_9HELO|nr:uncharacterized protein RAG0_00201 [Rhynchosporium agropyri]
MQAQNVMCCKAHAMLILSPLVLADSTDEAFQVGFAFSQTDTLFNPLHVNDYNHSFDDAEGPEKVCAERYHQLLDRELPEDGSRPVYSKNSFKRRMILELGTIQRAKNGPKTVLNSRYRAGINFFYYPP